MSWSLYCGLPVPLISLWHLIFSSKISLRLCVDRCIVDDQFIFFPCGIFSFLRRTVYVYVFIVVLWMTSSSYFLVASFLFFEEQSTFMLIVVLWMTCSSYFLAASFLFFEEQSTFMCWSLYCGWPVPLIFFGASFLFLRRTVYVHVLNVALWMPSSSYFLVASFLFFEEESTFMCWLLYCGWPVPLIFFGASFLFFEEQSTFMCWSLYCGWAVPLISLWNPFFSSKKSVRLCVDRRIVDDQFLSFLCCFLSYLRRTVYVYVLTLYCGWPVPLISLWHPFFSSKNSLRLCVDRCIVYDQFLLFPCGILSFLRRTVYVYVLIVVLWMTSSSYFLVAFFLFFEEQSTFMCWSLHCEWPVPRISLRNLFFSSKNSLRLCVHRCIVDDQFLLFPCGIFSFLRRTVYVYVLIVVL